MAITELIFGHLLPTLGKDDPTVGVIQFDCVPDETHMSEAEITDHPVEATVGAQAQISDHIRVLPDSVEFNGVVTDTPLVYLASLAPSPVWPMAEVPGAPTTNRADAAYEKLRELMSKGVLLDVATSLRTYEDMAIRSLTVSRNASTGNVMDCRISLRQVTTATSLAIDAPVPDDVANNASAEQGKKDKEESTTKQDDTANESMAFGLLFG